MDRFSCAVTITGRWRKKMNKGSVNDTWLLTRIGASCRGAGFPLTWIQWYPHANSMIREQNLTGNNKTRRHLGKGFVNTFLAPRSAILVRQYASTSAVTNRTPRNSATGSNTSVFKNSYTPSNWLSLRNGFKTCSACSSGGCPKPPAGCPFSPFLLLISLSPSLLYNFLPFVLLLRSPPLHPSYQHHHLSFYSIVLVSSPSTAADNTTSCILSWSSSSLLHLHILICHLLILDPLVIVSSSSSANDNTIYWIPFTSSSSSSSLLILLLQFQTRHNLQSKHPRWILYLLISSSSSSSSFLLTFSFSITRYYSHLKLLRHHLMLIQPIRSSPPNPPPPLSPSHC